MPQRSIDEIVGFVVAVLPAALSQLLCMRGGEHVENLDWPCAETGARTYLDFIVLVKDFDSFVIYLGAREKQRDDVLVAVEGPFTKCSAAVVGGFCAIEVVVVDLVTDFARKREKGKGTSPFVFGVYVTRGCGAGGFGGLVFLGHHDGSQSGLKLTNST